MNCFYCRGVDTIEETTTRFCAYDTDTPFLVENVPASVCRLCGDESYKGDTIDTLEEIKNGSFLPQGFRVFQVFDFEDLERPTDDGIGVASTHPVNRDFVSDYLQQNWTTLLHGMSGWRLGVMPTREIRGAWRHIEPNFSGSMFKKKECATMSYHIDKSRQLAALQDR